jgi:hypothetical protein
MGRGGDRTVQFHGVEAEGLASSSSGVGRARGVVARSAPTGEGCGSSVI